MNETRVKSDYTYLRKRSQSTVDGNIFEHDYMTISPMDDLFSGEQQIIPSDHNFKFSVRLGYKTQKRHARNAWVLNPSDKEEWTLADVSGSSISDESYIRIKPDYSSLRDFAYYGSAIKLIQGAVNDVILNFPAELYFSKDLFPLNAEAGGTYYMIHNGYGINADTPTMNEATVDNPMRYLCLSNYNYDYYDKGTLKSTGVTFEITQKKGICIPEGGIVAECVATAGRDSFTIYTYRKGNDSWLIYDKTSYAGKSIRPCKEVIDNFFNEIDDFEYVLLDRKSKPIYRATFETPYETDKGNFYVMKDYIWPSYNDWNPDVDSGLYSKYVTDLIQLAQWHDEYDSNNMWRMETHEAIKNLDWTFFKGNGEDVEDMSNIDSSKIEAMIQIYGRAFDGIKRYIDNIKSVNNVTYNEKNNLPDYHLTDVVELSGWEAFTLNPTAQTETYSVNFYGGKKEGWNGTESNIAFMRNLKINTNYIQSMKGTREGIYTLLGLLGIKREEVEINENVAIAKPKNSYCHFENLYEYLKGENELDGNAAAKKATYPLFLDVAGINLYKEDDIDYDFSEGTYLNGLAVKAKTRYFDDGTLVRYCAPWFDRNVNHNGDWYFQCNGGWGLLGSGVTRDIYAPELTRETKLTNVYDESEGYLKFALNIEEMLKFPNGNIQNGDVCYVMDMVDIESYFDDFNLEDKVKADVLGYDDCSHYFILRDRDKSSLISEGWEYISLADIKGNRTEAAKKVIYLETIKEHTEGNNPHTGFGHYDDGHEYVTRMSEIFKYDIDNDGLTKFTKSDVENIKDYVFDVESGKTDNKKCWYFSNTQYDYTSTGGADKQCCGKLVKIVGGTRALDNSTGQYKEMGIANEDFTFNNNTLTKYESGNTEPYAPVVGDKEYSESSADSIINLKNMSLTFRYPYALAKNQEQRDAWKEYVENVVIEYVKQMIPATTIWTFHWADKSAPYPSDDYNGNYEESCYPPQGGEPVDPNPQDTPEPKKQVAEPYDYAASEEKKFVVDAVLYDNEDADGIDTVQYKDNNIIKLQ